jgi:hypothetical protein
MPRDLHPWLELSAGAPEQVVNLGLSLPVVRAGPEHRKVVHPCDS